MIFKLIKMTLEAEILKNTITAKYKYIAISKLTELSSITNLESRIGQECRRMSDNGLLKYGRVGGLAAGYGYKNAER